MRPPARHRVGQSVGRGYASAVEDVGRGLLPTLRALESAAADVSELDDQSDVLPALQYALHVAAERVLGLEPLPGLEPAHEDLGAALALAREETAAVAEALDEAGAPFAAGLVWEWRVSLFGVRLALRQLDERLAGTRAAAARPPYAPVVLIAVGVAAVLGGALADAWPVWLVGLVLVAVSTGLSQRRP